MKREVNNENFKILLSAIKKAAFKKYNEITSKENEQQCTTLCTFNLIQNDQFILCSLGTGTKAVGNNQLQDGYALHDCHAEIIAKRAFQVWIYKNLENTKFFKKINNQWQLLGELFVYISQPPCGQCSLHKESLIYGLSAARPFSDFNLEKVGELDLNEYRLRSTPTKTQTLVSHRNPSFSCSDKIMLWSVLGVQGCLLNRIILPIYIKCLLIDYRDNYSLRRGINILKRSGKQKNDLLKVNNKRISKQYCIRTPRVFYYKNKIFSKSPFHPNQDDNNRRINQNIQEQQYQSFSYVYIEPNQIEKINSINGQKFGITKKDFNKIKLMPCITKIQLFNQFKNVMKLQEEIQYCTEKQKNIKYRIQKNRIKELFQEWSPNKQHLEQFKI